jgi:hypothetical protein
VFAKIGTPPVTLAGFFFRNNLAMHAALAVRVME